MRIHRIISTLEELEEFVSGHGLPVLMIPWGENSGALHRVCRTRGQLESLFQETLKDSVHKEKVHVVSDPVFLRDLKDSCWTP